jgi:hypothetical protein
MSGQDYQDYQTSIFDFLPRQETRRVFRAALVQRLFGRPLRECPSQVIQGQPVPFEDVKQAASGAAPVELQAS